MNLADIIQIKFDLKNEGYPVRTTMRKTKRYCFSDTTVTLCIMIPGRLDLWADIDLFNQTVYNVDYYSYPRNMVLRWVNPMWEGMFAKELFDRQEDPTVTLAGEQIRRYYDEDSIPAIISGDMFRPEDEEEEEEEYETVELDLSDSELATIARAAHAKDITINDFINEALIEELDRVMPDWREENRNGGL